MCELCRARTARQPRDVRGGVGWNGHRKRDQATEAGDEALACGHRGVRVDVLLREAFGLFGGHVFPYFMQPSEWAPLGIMDSPALVLGQDDLGRQAGSLDYLVYDVVEEGSDRAVR